MVTRMEENFNRNILSHFREREDGLDMKEKKHNGEKNDKNIDHGFSGLDEERMEVKETVKKDI